MIHVKQKNGMGSCGAVSFAAILGLSELQGIRECATDFHTGTCTDNVLRAFEARGIRAYRIDLNDKIAKVWWLEALSSHFPLYAVIKDGKSRHAVAIADAQVYDGHLESSAPLALYADRILLTVIVVDRELDSWGKSS